MRVLKNCRFILTFSLYLLVEGDVTNAAGTLRQELCPFILKGLSVEFAKGLQTTVPEKIHPWILTNRLLIGSRTSYDPFHSVRGLNWRSQIFDRTTLQYLGYIDAQLWDGTAKLPIELEKDAQGKGVGTEAKFSLIDLVFREFDISEIVALIGERNTASIALHRKLGFENALNRLNPFLWKLNRDRFKKNKISLRFLKPKEKQLI